MDRFGPFEPGPHLALGFSGGPDSTALLHFLLDWAGDTGGSVTALIVDHRLRPESTAEARLAAERARGAGAGAVVLTRAGNRPQANLQAEARAARYRMMADWCAAEGVLHLLLAHHREDQAETLLMRLARGSGVDGLAAMAPLAELPELRVLRPLLDTPKTRLRATLEARGLLSIDDPSNDDERFDRVRVRRMMPDLVPLGLGAGRLAATAGRIGRARHALEEGTARLLAGAAAVFPEGYAWLDSAALLVVPEEIALRALSRLVAAIGGRLHPPRLDRVERLYGSLLDGTVGGGRTLAGCRIRPMRGGILVFREAGAVEDVAAAVGNVLWDGRFRLDCPATRPGLEIRKLGQPGWQQVVQDRPALRSAPLPAAVRASLPAVWGLDGVLEVPHLCYVRTAERADDAIVRNISFAPLRSIQATRFTMQERAVNTR